MGEPFETPFELNDLVSDFMMAYSNDRPQNVLQYAVMHFNQLLDRQNRQNVSPTPNVELESSKITENKSVNEGDDFKPCDASNGDDSNDSDVLDEPPPSTALMARRKSIFTETIDPSYLEEKSDDDEEKPMVPPKNIDKRRRLSASIQHLLMFRSLSLIEVNEIVDGMLEKAVKAGETVIKQGDKGDEFYVVAEGKFSAIKAVDREDGTVVEEEVAQYYAEGSFGELSLMYDVPRSATVRAITDGAVWVMKRETFRKYILKHAFQRRKSFQSFIEKVEIFRNLKDLEKYTLTDAFHIRVYEKDEIIVTQGEDADGMYFVDQGVVRVVKQNADLSKIEPVIKLEKGSYFGEMALINKKPRVASVFADTADVRLAFLNKGAFERLLGPCMNIMKRNMNVEV